jgi:hypothetical protein
VNPLYLLIELAATVLFVAVAVAALRRGRLPFLELVSAAIFGLILEQANQLLYETYEYSTEFALTIDRAPIIIGLTWALIIAGAMRITDALGVRRRYAPFVDSVLAIMLDLAFDAVAIRMGLWTWRDIGLTDGWYGVPAGNFYAWLFVTLGFTFLTRWLREAAARRPALEWLQLAVPLPAFAILSVSIVSFAIIATAIGYTSGGGLSIFAVTVLVFVAIAAWGIFGPDRIPPDGEAEAMLDLRLAFVVRIAIHLFFLGALLAMGLATEAPVLLVVALLMLGLEAPLGWLVAMRRHALRRSSVRPRAGASRP